jgi:DNA mismatch repair ATPase MutL
MTMKGGNTDELYKKTNERLEFAQSLESQHPDCVKIIRRYNRWHHSINFNYYKKNKLIKKNDINIKLNNIIKQYI